MNGSTLKLLVAIFTIKYDAKKVEKLLKPWHVGTLLRVVCEKYPLNINMTGFRWFVNIFISSYPCALDESSFSIGRVK